MHCYTAWQLGCLFFEISEMVIMSNKCALAALHYFRVKCFSSVLLNVIWCICLSLLLIFLFVILVIVIMYLCNWVTPGYTYSYCFINELYGSSPPTTLYHYVHCQEHDFHLYLYTGWSRKLHNFTIPYCCNCST